MAADVRPCVLGNAGARLTGDPHEPQCRSTAASAGSREAMRVGHVERAILEALAEDYQQSLQQIIAVCRPQASEVTGSVAGRASRATYESFRRAAHRLEEKGLIVTGYRDSGDGHRRLWLHARRQGRALPQWAQDYHDGTWATERVKATVVDVLQQQGPLPQGLLRSLVHEALGDDPHPFGRGAVAITRAVRSLEDSGELHVDRTRPNPSAWPVALDGQSLDDAPASYERPPSDDGFAELLRRSIAIVEEAMRSHDLREDGGSCQTVEPEASDEQDPGPEP